MIETLKKIKERFDVLNNEIKGLTISAISLVLFISNIWVGCLLGYLLSGTWAFVPLCISSISFGVICAVGFFFGLVFGNYMRSGF